MGDDKWHQPICNFILALAVIYNDYADIEFAQTLRNQARPCDDAIESPEFGYHKALGLHLGKLLASLIFELFALIRDNAKLLEGVEYLSIYKKLPKQIKISWSEIVGIAISPDARKTTNGKMLLMARHKVTSHYLISPDAQPPVA